MTDGQRPVHPVPAGQNPYPAPPEYPGACGQQPGRTGQHPYPLRGQHPYDPRETRTDQPAYVDPEPGPAQPHQLPPQPSRRPRPVHPPAEVPLPRPRPADPAPPRPAYHPAAVPPPRPPVRPTPGPGRDPWPVGYKMVAGLFAVFTVIIGVSAVKSHKPPAAVSMIAATAQVSPSATAAKAGTRVIATFSGSGITNTSRFTVSATWRLDYSFTCGALGQAGNFIVREDGSFGAMAVDELAESKTGFAYAYRDAGAHYLEIDSECDWTVKVSDAG